MKQSKILYERMRLEMMFIRIMSKNQHKMEYMEVGMHLPAV